MEKFVNLAKIMIICSASIIIVCCLTYNYNTSAVSKDDSVKQFVVKENETFLSLATSLKENNLIQSEKKDKILNQQFEFTIVENMDGKIVVNNIYLSFGEAIKRFALNVNLIASVENFEFLSVFTVNIVPSSI